MHCEIKYRYKHKSYGRGYFWKRKVTKMIRKEQQNTELPRAKSEQACMEVDPQFGIHKAVKSLKGYTSRILREEFPYLRTKIPTLWTNSYFVSTVGGAPL